MKRTIDLILASLSLIGLAIPFGVIVLAIKLESKGPIFFRQERIGKSGQPFRVWKFRTMIESAENFGLGRTVMEGDWRITKVGSWLRDWGLDELPQLLNVVLGDMSIVGPRPTLGYQVEQYGEYERKRLLVKPGLTGLAVCRGRNSLTWAERIDLDIWYVENLSLWIDFKIIIRTFWVVLVTREGLYGPSGTNDDFVSTHADVLSTQEIEE